MFNSKEDCFFQWYDIIGEKTIANAILDWLIHKSHRVELHGESMRKKKSINKG
ncbi:ATP-binding protein [Flavobacterium sp. WG21]|uniref:ATP-binding protein n=1 Tax=Flavobacterium sp. WG21 TaxID=1229487 RepID=UPI0026F3C937|nr:ATP-binding protein [Flavobacterium sp. WG21]